MAEFKKVTIVNNESKQIIAVHFIKPEKLDPWLDFKVVQNVWGQVDEYDVFIEDTSLEKMEALSYLHQTDWYILREIDDGTPVPSGVKQKRSDAREILGDDLVNIKGVLLDQVVEELK